MLEYKWCGKYEPLVAYFTEYCNSVAYAICMCIETMMTSERNVSPEPLAIIIHFQLKPTLATNPYKKKKKKQGKGRDWCLRWMNQILLYMLSTRSRWIRKGIIVMGQGDWSFFFIKLNIWLLVIAIHYMHFCVLFEWPVVCKQSISMIIVADKIIIKFYH